MRRILLLFVFSSFLVSAQSVVIGKITSEEGVDLPGATIFNVNSEKAAQSDRDGNFLITAKAGDRLRFVRTGHERREIVVAENSFSTPVNVSLPLLAYAIEEVKIGFVPSGILRKDVRALDAPLKVRNLNESIAASLKFPPKGAYPGQNYTKMPSTLASGPNFSAGQMNILGTGGGLLGLASDLLSGKNKNNYNPTISESEGFQNRVLASINKDYFYQNGLDEYQLEIFIAYADRKLNLTKEFYSNFNIQIIESYLKSVLPEYLKTRVLNAPVKKEPA